MAQRMTPAQLRAAAEEKMQPLASRRVRLLSELEQVETELRPLVLAAVEAEVPQRRISALTALSTTTIRKWVREAADAP